ncbi:MAG: iron uptake porin [Synechococcaceae cyanobacterium]|nr:iron uptake porin [Synechococcaceae cyanobacterium]
MSPRSAPSRPHPGWLLAAALTLAGSCPLSAAEARSEVRAPDLAAIDRYAGSSRPEAATAFQDLRPTDWAWQALVGLIERHGCVAGLGGGVFAGNRPISRFEAAALLEACLTRSGDSSEDMRRLSREFAAELAQLRARSDRLEARIGAIDAAAFSTTTKLSGLATMVIGTNQFSGSAIRGFPPAVQPTDEPEPLTLLDSTSFNYDLQLTLDTSFSGKDLLRTILRAGNFDFTAFGDYGLRRLSVLEAAFDEPINSLNTFNIDKFFYQFPLGDQFTATVGPRVGQEDMLAVWPSVYPADTVLNLMTLNGAGAAYNLNLGPGFGLWWQSPSGWSVSANLVSAYGNFGSDSLSPDLLGQPLISGGRGTTTTLQIAYHQPQWAVAAVYSRIQPGTVLPGSSSYVISQVFAGPADLTHAFGLSGYWQPAESGWMPSISLGYGYNTTHSPEDPLAGNLLISQSWQVALQWTDAFVKGNSLGLSVAQPVVATTLTGGFPADDQALVLEGWYSFQVSDGIRLTPAAFYIQRPLGRTTPAGTTFNQFGALLKSTFTF